MEGRVSYINTEKGYGYIKTGNNEIGDLNFKFESFDGKKDDTVSFEVAESKNGKKYAKNVKVVKRNKSKYNTEDKNEWYKEGERLEVAFVEEIVPQLEVNLIINPDKINDPSVIDLMDIDNKRFADLKTQNTPFFYAKSKDKNYDPRFTVTFNKKDYERYCELYPDCDIYWYVNWKQLSYNKISIEPLEGVWVAKFSNMAKKIENKEVYLHSYNHRVNDDQNAKESYLFDLRDKNIFVELMRKD